MGLGFIINASIQCLWCSTAQGTLGCAGEVELVDLRRRIMSWPGWAMAQPGLFRETTLGMCSNSGCVWKHLWNWCLPLG